METRSIVVDTDIIIDYLRHRQPGADMLKAAYLRYPLAVTSITVYELMYGVQATGNEEVVLRFLRHVTVVPLDEAAATKAAVIHHSLRSKGMDIGVKDSFIAGICVAHDLPLLTRNVKHFSRIDDIRFAKL